MTRTVRLIFVAALATAATAGALQGATALAPAVWLALMLAPGYALLRVFDPAPRPVALLAVALAVSPAMTAACASLALLAGADASRTAVALCAWGGVAAFAAAVPARGHRAGLSASKALWLAGLVVLLCALTSALPLSDQWWRIRSDAWFHRAVVYQIEDFGLPVEDPYFVGLPLQYMWFYHVLVLVLSHATGLEPFWIMALVNVQALAGFVLAVFLFASVLQARFWAAFASAAMVPLGFNALYWLFLPLKAARALTGEVRGAEELARVYSLTPFTYSTATGFMHVYYNQEFFLDKFMVATAFSLGLAAMALAWYAASAYIASRARAALVVVFVSVIGMLGFHSLVGFVTLVAIGGGVILLALRARGTSGYAPRAGLALLGTAVAGFLVMTPYLYAVMHAKETEQVIPFGLSLRKTGGILVSCALALLLAWRQRSFFARHDAAARFVLYAALSVTAFCLVIQLPGPNTYDKLGYFVYFPIAVVGGWTLAEFVQRKPSPRARRLAAVALSAACFLPVNGLTFAACFATPPKVMVTPDELRLSAWARDHTPREGVFIDDDDRVFLLVTGPRRYFCGRLSYAQQWGYDKMEMSERYHARRALYGHAPLDATALEKLGNQPGPLYAVRRGGDTVFARHPEYFTPLVDFGPIGLVQIDTDACRRAALDPDLPRVSKEDLLRESGL